MCHRDNDSSITLVQRQGHTYAGWQRVVDIVFPGRAMHRWIMHVAVVYNLPNVQIIKCLS